MSRREKHDQQAESITDRENPDTNAYEHSPSIITIPDPLTDEAKHRQHDREYKDRQIRTNRWIIAATAATAIAGLWQGHLTRKAVANSEQALTQARAQFRDEQRPYIWLTNNLGQPLFVHPKNLKTGASVQKITQMIWTWHITNYGKSPAYSIRVWQYSRIGGNILPQFIGGKQTATAVDIGAPLPPTGDQFNTVVSPPIASKQMRQLFGIDSGLGIEVRIQYEDSYGTLYESGFCYDRLVSGALNYCKDRNYMRQLRQPVTPAR